MSKQQKTTRRKVVISSSREKLKPTSSRARATQKSTKYPSLIFGWENYKVMLVGIACIALGMILMLGGDMPDPNQWDESVIYSFRRITLAPLLILVGMGIEIYAIFRK
jgi:hypothetical protein